MINRLLSVDFRIIMFVERRASEMQHMTGLDCFHQRRVVEAGLALYMFIQAAMSMWPLAIVSCLCGGVYLWIGLCHTEMDDFWRKAAIRGYRNSSGLVVEVALLRLAFVLPTALSLASVALLPLMVMQTMRLYLAACTPQPPGPSLLSKLRDGFRQKVRQEVT